MRWCLLRDASFTRRQTTNLGTTLDRGDRFDTSSPCHRLQYLSLPHLISRERGASPSRQCSPGQPARLIGRLTVQGRVWHIKRHRGTAPFRCGIPAAVAGRCLCMAQSVDGHAAEGAAATSHASSAALIMVAITCCVVILPPAQGQQYAKSGGQALPGSRMAPLMHI